MKKLILLRGLPGSGKTTFAEFLSDFILFDVTVCMFAADDYFTSEDGTYRFDANKLGAAHAQCERNAKEAMANPDEETIVIVHNTFTTEKELKPYLEMAKEYGFDVTSLVVENRHGNKSVHGVPEEVMGKMKGRFSLRLTNA